MQTTLGAVFTPTEVADLLTRWAIRSAGDTILDLGLGEGAFVFSSFYRLQELGATSKQSASQIYGTEIDETRYATLQQFSATKQGTNFPNLQYKDFFQATFPKVDVVVGNPPYVRRRAITPGRIKEIRSNVLETNLDVNEKDLSQLTDLYVYFLLKAVTYLRLQGRLAVVISDSWLNVRYGQVLRQYLLENFKIEHVISFDRPIFPDAQVKPVLLFATKHSQITNQVAFTRVMNGLPVNALSPLFTNPEPKLPDVHTVYVSSTELGIAQPWGTYLKIAEIINVLNSRHKLVPLQELANVRIGLQTLAKDFFTLTNTQIQDLAIESEFLQPLAHSVSQFDQAVIDVQSKPSLHLFFCANPKDELIGTNALTHIETGENTEVTIRGRGEVVTGYNQKPRIKKANRPSWYDIKTSVEKRGRAPILIPRLIYYQFKVLWNQAHYVPGDAVIEVLPKSPNLDVQLLLAVLNSTYSEVLIRGYAQLYGGGACTVGINQLKQMPILNLESLTNKQKQKLVVGYQAFLKDGNRDKIDEVIYKIIGLDHKLFESTVKSLRLMATSAKQ